MTPRPGCGPTETAVTPGELSSPQPHTHPGEWYTAGRTVPTTVFTHPEVAVVGVPQSAIDGGSIQADIIMPVENQSAAADF